MNSKKTMRFLLISSVVLATVIAASSSIYANKQEPKYDPLVAFDKIDKSSKDGLLKFKKQNEEKIKDVKNLAKSEEEIMVTVTFSKYLSEDELKKVVNSNQLRVHHIIGRGVEPDGKESTFVMEPTKDGQIVNKDVLGDWETRFQSKTKGFIELGGYVRADQIEKLSKDTKIYSVDVSADQHLANNPKKKFAHGVFWEIEHKDLITE
jgi:hypothetical protein